MVGTWWGHGELASRASFKEGGAWELRLSFSHLVPCGNVVPILPDLQIFFFFPREARNLEFYEKSSNFQILATNSKYF